MLEQAFRGRFNFKPELSAMVGVEREFFLTSAGRIVAAAEEVLGSLNLPWLGYELSACQLESHLGPLQIGQLRKELEQQSALLEAQIAALGYGCLHLEVATHNLPLEVYPEPRYLELAQKMSREQLCAACMVTGTHIHIGMPDAETALNCYNRVVGHWRELAEMGDGSGGQRLAIYRQVAADPEPKPYADWRHFAEVARARGFWDNPRNCWDLIRISRHGSIEFRMFGASGDLQQIAGWAERCWELCQN